jgi:ABC-type multidrug transport system fused ATPase/permease subunit
MMTMVLSRADFDARYVSDSGAYSSESGQEWLADRFRRYRMNADWIEDHYDDEPTRDRLMRAIVRQKPGEEYWDRDREAENFMWGGLYDVIQAKDASPGKCSWTVFDIAFDAAPGVVEGYLNSAPEFKNRKVDTFFVRFALNAAIRAVEKNVTSKKEDFKTICFVGPLGAVLLLVGWRVWWLGFFGFILFLLLLALPFVIRDWIKAARKVRAAREIRNDIHAESYDAETVIRRLVEIERTTGVKLPSYAFTLLRRRAALGPECIPAGRRQSIATA